MNKIEVLAPAGSKEALISAINNGADAVYFGGMSFGARASANNFSNEEIVEIIDYCHSLDVLVYVTVNTLIKDEEFDEAIKFVEFLYVNNCDAIIVQDLGLLDVVRQKFPQMDIHISTQMNVHTYEQALFLKNLGVKRIVLAREISLETVKQIAKIPDLELEVFVHGALCMSYSGNCYISSIIGKRSGNRGRCAQPCRMQYTLEGVTDKEYLLSTKDLMSIDYLDELVEIGVKSLKIEGRLKRAEYVGLAVKSYKNALEKKLKGNEKKNLALMFNREFTKGFLNYESNSDFSNTKSPNHIGVVCGKVIKTNKLHAYIKLTETLNNNDSLRILSSREDGITINNDMEVNNKIVKTANIGDTIKVRCHHEVDVDSVVLKTTDSVLIEEINNIENKKIGLYAKLSIKDKKLVLELSDGKNSVFEESETEIIASDNENFIDRIITQIHKTNNTHYFIKDLEVNVSKIFLPIKEINQIRRNALEKINKARIARPTRTIHSYKKETVLIENTKRLFVKVKTKKQLLDALEVGIKDIIVEDRKLLNPDYPNIIYMSPRISNKLTNYDASGNFDSIDNKLLNSVYFNVFNHYAVNFMHNQGVKTVGLSIELSKNEIGTLINSFKKNYSKEPNVMMMVYGYYDLMILKHCFINKALGLDHKGCNRCREEQFYIKDRVGSRFPLIDDGKCNLKILNNKRLHLINHMKDLMSLGVNNFLLEFTIEEDIKEILKAYLDCFKGLDYNIYLEDITNGHISEGVI